MYARPQRVKDKRRRTFSGASENVSLMRVVTVACGSTSISTARVWPGCRHCVGYALPPRATLTTNSAWAASFSFAVPTSSALRKLWRTRWITSSRISPHPVIPSLNDNASRQPATTTTHAIVVVVAIVAPTSSCSLKRAHNNIQLRCRKVIETNGRTPVVAVCGVVVWWCCGWCVGGHWCACMSAFDRRSFVVRRSSFVVRRSSFVLRPSSFVVRPSSFVLRPSSFLCPSSFVLRPSFRRSDVRRSSSTNCRPAGVVAMPPSFRCRSVGSHVRVGGIDKSLLCGWQGGGAWDDVCRHLAAVRFGVAACLPLSRALWRVTVGIIGRSCNMSHGTVPLNDV